MYLLICHHYYFHLIFIGARTLASTCVSFAQTGRHFDHHFERSALVENLLEKKKKSIIIFHKLSGIRRGIAQTCNTHTHTHIQTALNRLEMFETILFVCPFIRASV